MKFISLALAMMMLMPATVLGASLMTDMNSDASACCCGFDTAVHLEAPLECPCCVPGVPAPDVTPGLMIPITEAPQTNPRVQIATLWPERPGSVMPLNRARVSPDNTPIRLQICRINR